MLSMNQLYITLIPLIGENSIPLEEYFSSAFIY